jgi:hypothetical protein
VPRRGGSCSAVVHQGAGSRATQAGADAFVARSRPRQERCTVPGRPNKLVEAIGADPRAHATQSRSSRRRHRGLQRAWTTSASKSPRARRPNRTGARNGSSSSFQERAASSPSCTFSTSFKRPTFARSSWTAGSCWGDGIPSHGRSGPTARWGEGPLSTCERRACRRIPRPELAASPAQRVPPSGLHAAGWRARPVLTWPDLP